MDELKCLDCGHIGEPLKKEIYNYGDADGNRGIFMNYFECPKCGSEDLDEDFEYEDEN